MAKHRRARLPASNGAYLTWALGILVMALAGGLATWSLGFGLPFLFRPDEDVMVGRAVRMAAQGSLDPLFANYPPLVFYLFAGVEKAVSLFGGGTLHAAFTDPTSQYLSARAVSAAAAVAAVGFTFWAGRSAYGRAGGAVAGGLLAVAPLAVRQAHFATTDGVQTALVAASFAAALLARDRRGFAGAGALVGLAAAAKYTGGLALIFSLVLAASGDSRDRRGRLGATILGALVAFAIPCLVILWHPSGYLAGLRFITGNLESRGSQLPLGWIYHPTVTLPFGLGPGSYALCLAGLGLALVRRRPVDLALCAYAFAYWALSGSGHEDFFRYELPLLPALCLLAGGAIGALPPRLLTLGAAATVLLAVPSVYATVRTDVLLGTPDTRAVAAAWMEAHLAPGTDIQTPYYASPFYGPRQVEGNLRWVDDRLAASFAQGRYTARFRIDGPDPQVILLASGPPWQAPLPKGATPLFTIKPYRGPPPRGAIYDPIDSFWLPIWGFGRIDRPGPSISIIRAP